MYTYQVLSRIPDFVPLFGVLLGGIYWITHRREDVAKARPRRSSRKAVGNDGPESTVHLLEGDLRGHHGGGRLLHLSPFLPRAGRVHQPQRPVSLGPVDRL